MQKSARCRGLWWFKYSFTCTFSLRNASFLHTSMPSNEKTHLQQHPSTREQELSTGSIEEQYQQTEQLRQRNCWKLWHLRRLSVEEISSILHMRQDTIINIILSFERKMENVDWLRLCKLVMLTTSTARAILVARSKAKREMPSLRGATLFSASDIKNFCPQNVTHSHIYLVHVMLGQNLTSSEILDLASCTDRDSKGTYEAEATDSNIQRPCQAGNTDMDFKGTYETEATDLDPQKTYRAENTANARIQNRESVEYEENINYGSGEERVDFLSPVSIARHGTCDCTAVDKEYADLSLNMSLGGANGRRLASHVCHEERDIEAFRYMPYDSKGAKDMGFHHKVPVLEEQNGKILSSDAKHEEIRDSTSVRTATEQKVVTMFDILLWLRKNHRATVSNIVMAFGDCEVKHLLFLILEMLESSIIVEQEGMLRIASELCASRLDRPTESSQALFNSSTNKRMHRALCLKAVVLKVVIHEPKMNVEFVIRHVKAAADESPIYHVRICKCPSCTCRDFAARFKAGLDYMPCKHLFYVYFVQLHVDKNHEHLMLQEILKEEELEKILEGHY